jgi:MerR family transcriptional regulator, light-induced transcriptional regulator
MSKGSRIKDLTSSEAAALLGVSLATIKRWADAGILSAVRTAGGHRRFERNAIEKLSESPLLATGLEVDRWMRQLLECDDGLPTEATLLVERSKAEGWFAVAEALGAMLDEVGRRWQEGRLSVSDEHVLSARLCRALAHVSATLPVRAGAPRALLATLEGEGHTLGLSLVELCVREWGWATTWEGRETPVPELERIVSRGRSGALLLSSSIAGDPAQLTAAAHQLAAACRSARVGLVMGGRGSWPDPPPFGRVLRSFRDLRGWMARFERGFLS